MLHFFATLPILFLKRIKTCYNDFMHPILKIHIEKKEFHHAYLLCGEVEAGKKTAEEMAKVILAESHLNNHPDFSYSKFGLFGINDSHNLANRASNKSFSDKGKIFVLEVFSFNMESSNALLKLLEEPTEKTHFFVIVSSVDVVIPTLRSRFTIIGGVSNDKEIDEESLEAGKKFLSALPSKRLETVKKMFPKKSEENELLSDSSANKQESVKLLNALEFLLEKELRTPGKEKKAKEGLENLSKSGQFVFDRGSSPKIILEHLALTLPRI